MEGKYVGAKKIKKVVETGDKTPNGLLIVGVQYEDDTEERMSVPMLQASVSEKPTDLTQLRDKRIFPVVESVLLLLRDWGIKVGELGYLSAVLNRSLDNNYNEAMRELWSKWMPIPLTLEDVDLLTVDRVLKSKGKVTLDDVLGKS